jgi:hypothetical protein
MTGKATNKKEMNLTKTHGGFANSKAKPPFLFYGRLSRAKKFF